MGLRIAAAGALAFALLFAAQYARRPALTLTSDAELNAFGTGFYPVERSGNTSHVWTRPRADVAIDDLDRSVPWRLQATVHLWRPPDAALPRLRVLVDNRTAFDEVVARDFPLDVAIPRGPHRGIRLAFDVTPPFTPGEGDPRQLGVALTALSMTPIEGKPRPSLAMTIAGALAVFAAGLAFAGLRLPRLWLIAAVLAIAWAVALLATIGTAPFVSYGARLAVLAILMMAGVYTATRVIEWRHGPLSTAARAAAAISAAAGFLKLAVLLHPQMPIGDGVFHAHRLGYVLGGQFYFTSLAPGDYAFPYPVLLYVVAAPFTLLAPDVLSRVALLRIVATVTDVVAGAMLYWMVIRTTKDRLAAVSTIVWYHVIPMTAWIMTWGNLTNAFGQALFVVAVALVAALPIEWGRWQSVAIVAAVASAAFLSHPSTFAILTGTLVATTALYAWRGGAALRTGAIGLAAAVTAAGITATVLYYAWFSHLYVTELGRVGSAAAARAAGADNSIGSRLAEAAVLAGRYFGWAVFVPAVAGGWRLWTDKAQPRLTLLLAGWLGICGIFLVVGVLTPLVLRYHFAAFPALAILAGYGCAWWWQSRSLLRLTATAALAVGLVIGVDQWTWVLFW